MKLSRYVTTALALLVLAPASAPAQETSVPPTLTLTEAVDLALRHNFALSRARLDAESAGEGVRRAWSGVFPRIDGRASYTRTIGALNPFAGSEASDLISRGLAGDFLSSDKNPDTTLREAFDRFVDAQTPAAGQEVDNPFFIENIFSAQVGATQVLFDSTVFEGIGAARSFESSQAEALGDVRRLLAQQVAAGFYGVLLAQARLEVLKRSEARSQTEVSEAEALVAEGLQPRTTQLSAEVQLNNTRTDRLRAENTAAGAADQFKVLLGVSAAETIVLDGTLETLPTPPELPKDLASAVGEAVAKRPDLRSLALEIERQDRRAAAIWGEYLPRFEAVFTFRAIGQVPDDRGGEDFFSNRFWGPDITGGLVLTWNLFNGFDTSSRLAQARIAEARARVDLEERRAIVRAEVAQELRDVRTALAQIESQKNNVGRAELNYEQTRLRVQEGVTGRAELRNASQQLDESRLNLLQAIHDYRVADVDYRVAIGLNPFSEVEQP
ncbi:MAG: TolC family protein [Myxococcota bacterium]